ncbi:hypothetical protein D3C75_1100370 [compost metagenome]
MAKFGGVVDASKAQVTDFAVRQFQRYIKVAVDQGQRFAQADIIEHQLAIAPGRGPGWIGAAQLHHSIGAKCRLHTGREHCPLFAVIIARSQYRTLGDGYSG